MKRAISILVGVALAVGMMGLSGCDGGYEDDSTIGGMFSGEEYQTEKDAVKAFQDELGGELYKVTVKKYSHGSKVPEERINELNTDNLEKDEKVTSGRRVLVTCTQKSNADESAEAEEKSFHAEIYEIKSGDETHYRYYVNKSDYEGMVSKSYYEYLEDLKGMNNFTYLSTTTTKATTGERELTETYNRTAMVDGNKISLKISQPIMMNVWLYMERTDDKTQFWTSVDGKDYKAGEDLSDILGPLDIDPEEIGELGYLSSEAGIELDQTYFMPAEDGGFTLREGSEGKFLVALSDEIKEMLGSASGKIDVDGDVSFDFSVNEYGVSDLKCEMSVSVNILGVAMEETVTVESSFLSVGTTKVERPEGIE